MAVPEKSTFIARAFRSFGENVAGIFGRVNDWRESAGEAVQDFLDGISEWLVEHKWGFIFTLASLIWVGLMGWLLVDLFRGKVAGGAVQVGVAGLIGNALVGLLVSPLIALASWLVLLIIPKVFKLVTPLVLFLPLIVWTPLYAVWQLVIVLAKLLLLAPLFLLFIGTRLIQLWRRIFFTCPSRDCSYRGLPAYLCPKCGTGNPKLWPNLYGLLWHPCVKCGELLPALRSLGRKKLQRLCGGCGIPLVGRHAGRAPERLVAIAGAPSSGKTNYLLSAVDQIVHGDSAVPIRGSIDDPAQEREFRREWEGLAAGRVAAKTAAVASAFILYARAGNSKCQLYLYDAPGEEFTSIRAMSRQQYFNLLEGFVVLVDPLPLAAGPAGAQALQNVVAATVATASSGPAGRAGKLRYRVAVVISKADEQVVKQKLGQVAASGAACRKAIVDWGGASALLALEHHFESVEYFACSALGRPVDPKNREPFKGRGVLEPLGWVLGAGKSG